MKRHEDGSATVVSATATAAFMALILIMIDVTGDVLDRHRAQVSADLAAVAAATALWFGNDACAAAAPIAAQNSGGVLRDCRIDGTDVLVHVEVGDATARARAGPL